MADSNLKRTLIIPENGPLAIQLFKKAVADLDVVLFVILGSENHSLVKKADWRARALPTRQVVWILDPQVQEMCDVVAKIKQGDDQIIAATYSKTDKIVDRLVANDVKSSPRVEAAFSRADAAN